MEEKGIRNRIKEIESGLKFYKEELDKITLAKEFAELRGIYELFKNDTFIKVENSNKVERYGVPVTIYHIKDKQELKLNTALHRYSFIAHFDSSIVFDRESKKFSITNYTAIAEMQNVMAIARNINLKQGNAVRNQKNYKNRLTMRKIMFSDKYRLTKAVFEGRKTQTRRIVKDVDLIQYLNELEEDDDLKGIKGKIVVENNALYKVGKIVAIAQCYSDIEDFLPFDRNFDIERGGKERAGWDNKMFVEATYMPHHIRITDVRVERLQDISDEDCIAEGIVQETECESGEKVDLYSFYTTTHFAFMYHTAREAYSALIDKISGKGTWDANPFVFVYGFELVD